VGIYYDPQRGAGKRWVVTKEKVDYTPEELKTDRPTNFKRNDRYQVDVCAGPYFFGLNLCWHTVKEWRDNWVNDTTKNSINKELNADGVANQKQLKINQDKNAAYDKTVATASSTQGGDYVNRRDILRNIQNIDDTAKTNLENQFKIFYRTEKLQRWDPKLGAKPPYGEFDANFYKRQNQAVAEQWKTAVNNDDVDIVERYGENGFYLQHYTNQGKQAGLRGNAVEKTIQANAYKEVKPTDKEIQDVRTKQLNVAPGTETTSGLSSINERILKVPEVQKAWTEAKQGDAYWKSLAQANYLNVNNADQFAALFRLSTRPADKQVVFSNNLNADPQNRITDLEDEINTAVGAGQSVDTQRFGALVQDSLARTVKKLKETNAQNQQLALMRGFSTFSEITDINKELTNSILGDTGIGGLLEFTGGAGKTQEAFEKKIEGVTGVKSNVVYNWQNWFDKELVTQYNKDLELGYSTGQAKEMIKISKDFANKFVTDYLKPRFDTSKSMDEFIEYMDIRQQEQSPFTTQDVYTGLKDIANARSKSYLDEIQKISDRVFDTDFYFNPTGNKAKEGDYATQAKQVADDWTLAKKQVAQKDGYWYQQAYRFGVDINDKASFARMHFETQGQGKGFDAAKDILNAGAVQDYISKNITPALKDYISKNPGGFSKFVLPEEFADALLKGVNPADKTQWETVLKKIGLSDFKGTLDELKEYITQTFRTGSAQTIRENIKYLNEQRLTPTQARLGAAYIERPQDFTNKPTTPTTELYNVFQKAGYQGSEDDFYTKFFPDLDKSEQQLLTKAGTSTALKMQSYNLKNPFEAFSTLSTLLGEDEATPERTSTAKSRDASSFFNLGLGDTEDSEYKSKTGSQILGEFTSLFKGF